MPELLNQSPYSAQLIPLFDARGAPLAVVVVKATYDVDRSLALHLADPQEPLLFADAFVNPALPGDIRLPSDLVDVKPATDVIVVRPSGELRQSRLFGKEVGIEIAGLRARKKVEDRWPFGPLRRDLDPRRAFAGTYDAKWIEERMPLLPEDFDLRFNLAAPQDQIVAGYCRGNEVLRVSDLYLPGTLDVRLPGRAVVVAGSLLGRHFTRLAVLDTILVWSDRARITLVWRLSLKLRQKIEEVADIYVYAPGLRCAMELFGPP